MKFVHALDALKNGKAVKLPRWTGYWKLENGRVKMHCKDGKVIDLQDSDDILFTLSNIASEYWEVVEHPERIKLGAKPYTFGFDVALRELKAGKLVTRKGWNGKGMFIYITKGTDIQKAAGYGFGEYVGEPTIVDTICMKTAQDTIVFGWVASQTDMLADDWMIAGESLSD